MSERETINYARLLVWWGVAAIYVLERDYQPCRAACSGEQLLCQRERLPTMQVCL